MTTAIVYLIAIVIAETVTVYIQPVWGVVCHIMLLVALTVHSSVLARAKSEQQLLLSLALAPLVRIMSLSMPLVNIPQILWYPLIYTPLLVAALIVMRISNYTLEEVGLSLKRIRVQLAFAAAGLVLGIMEYLILKPQPMIDRLTWRDLWLPSLLFLVFVGFVEEFIFRGVIQRAALDSFGWKGLVYVSFIFAFLHIGFLSWIDVIFVFLVVLFFSWVVKRTGSLLGVTLAHGITNIMLYLVVPFFFV